MKKIAIGTLKKRLNKLTEGKGIAWKFIIWTVAIIMLLDILAAIFMQMDLTNTLSEDFNDRGQTLSRHLAIESSGGESLPKDGTDMVNLQIIIDNVKTTESDVKYVYITDSKGKVIAHTFNGGFPSELLAINADTDSSPRSLNTEWGPIVEFRAPIVEGREGFVHIGIDRTPMDEKINHAVHLLFTNILIEGMLGIVMAYMAGNYLARPIRALVKGAEEIGRGNLGYQIEAGSTDEIHALSTAFNKMSYDLNKSISELCSSEKYLSMIIESSFDGIGVIDEQGRLEFANDSFFNIIGWPNEELIGQSFIKVLHEDDRDFVQERWVELQKGIEIPYETKIKTKSGEIKYIYVSSAVAEIKEKKKYIGIIKDITDQKEMEKLEKQLLQSDKLVMIGQLAAGVAHEINNPLGNISLYTQMLLKKTIDENTKDKLMTISDETDRAARIVKGLLDFARGSELQLYPVDINKEIGKILSILNLQLKDLSIQNPRLRDIRVVTDLQPVPLILADSGQIRQVVMNILTNSIQSITENGEISVKTTLKDSYVEISISDNGCGISKENMDKIFSPFFTTKECDKGTGLGLSICYGIIKRHNGSIEVKSEIGKGTTFTIKLPA